MKQHIAKLLVFLMLMTTMIVPADLSFAESINEQTTQTEENNTTQDQIDSTQETPAITENSQETVEDESKLDSSSAKESIIDAENEQLEETVTEKMEFLYIESKELSAPGTQNIVVSWKESIDDIENMVLVYENEKGQTLTLKELKRNDESIVFARDFAASEAGTYKIKGVKYFIGNEENYFAFDDVEIAASFKVIKGEDVTDDAVATVEVESNGTVNKKEVNAEIKDAVTSTDAVPQAQSKARSAKSGNVVIVLDPGHGGSDVGATRGSVYEKNINFKVAQYCKAELEQYSGVTVYMTRTDDTNLSLSQRAQIAANYGANILVSIHQNSGSSSAYGAEVYYPNRNYKPAIGDSGKAVADSIQKELVSLGLSNRGTKIRNTANGSTYADGSYSDYYGIIRNSKNLGIPAIIVEHAFLSNASDYNNFLSSDSKLQKLGIADATGIAKAFGLSKGRWINTESGRMYQFGDGTYARNQQIVLSGSVNQRCFYFDENGYLVKGIFQNKNNKVWYYADEETGGIRTEAGFVTWKGNKYYVTQGGAVAINTQIKLKDTIYSFDSSGKLVKEERVGTLISGQSEASINTMIAFYKKSNKKYPQEIYTNKGAANIEEFCRIYDEEAAAEGIKAEVAFCQAMKETGWLQFGGDVKASQCNFAGIGATGGGVSGASFSDVRTGVRAQIQHLKAYANTSPLNNVCVDPRFKYVKRGSAPYVEWLGKNANPNGVGWAPAADYGTSIVQMIGKLLSY